MATTDLTAPIEGASHSEVGGLAIDEVPAGDGRVKRVVYPPGWRWSEHMRPITGTDWCEHAHVGFLAQGRMTVTYADGCRLDFDAPAFVRVDPGHDGWVVGDEPAVLVQVDFGADTAARMGVADSHSHSGQE